VTITTIRVSYQRTWSLEPYGQPKFSMAQLRAECEATLAEGEDLSAAKVALWQEAREAVKGEFLRLAKPQESNGQAAPPAVSDPAFRAKVEEAESGPSLVKPPAPQGAAPAGGFPGGGTSVHDLGY
jgi:hypothetical protein